MALSSQFDDPEKEILRVAMLSPPIDPSHHGQAKTVQRVQKKTPKKAKVKAQVPPLVAKPSPKTPKATPPKKMTKKDVFPRAYHKARYSLKGSPPDEAKGLAREAGHRAVAEFVGADS